MGKRVLPTLESAEPIGQYQMRRFVRLPTYFWPVALLLIMVLAGMAYSIYWNRLYHHSSSWNTPSDIWATFRASQYVTWGGESQIYNNPAAFQTFPGMAIVLAPIAKVVGIFHLSTSFPLTLSRPSAWLILGPTELALGAVLLFPLDKLAAHLAIDERRRVYLLFAESVLIWPSVALWGHPEDALSLAFGIWALLAVFDGAWLRVAAFFGLAVAVQPLIVLILPIVVAYVPVKRWAAVGGGMVLPSLLLLLAPLTQAWGPTTRILLKQPNFPIHNHPTPWMTFAPVITAGHFGVTRVAKYIDLPGGLHRLIMVNAKVFVEPVVAAGPGRLVAIAIALIIGFLVKMRQPSMSQVIWLAALSLSLRCVFEPVMVPYYLMPGLVLALVVAARGKRSRFALASASAALCTLLSYRYISPWLYFAAMTCSVALVFQISWPGPNSTTVLEIAGTE